jgi:hypothetical protein
MISANLSSRMKDASTSTEAGDLPLELHSVNGATRR